MTSAEENIADAIRYLKKFDVEFSILGPTGRSNKDLVFEYYASPVSNPELVFTVESYYAVDNIFPFFPSIFKSKCYYDNFHDSVVKYAVEKSLEKQPIVLNDDDNDSINKATEQILEVMEHVNEELLKYGLFDTTQADLTITILGEETTFEVGFLSNSRIYDDLVRAFQTTKEKKD